MTNEDKAWAKRMRAANRPTIFVTSSARTAKDATYQIKRNVRTALNGRLFVEFDGSTFWVEAEMSGDRVMYYRSVAYRAPKDHEAQLAAEELEA